MTAESRVAVLGDPVLTPRLYAALRAQGISWLASGNLELRDEWQVRKWFVEVDPTHVFLCVGMKGQASVSEFSFSVSGSIHVLMAGIGIAERVRLVTAWPTPEFFLLRRLCELIYFEKDLDYLDIIAKPRETLEALAVRSVLEMSAISAKEANTRSAKGAIQRGEVRGKMVPEQAGNQQHGTQASAVLEVPVAAAQGALSGDLRAQPPSPEDQETRHPVHDHPGSVPGLVREDRLP